MNEPALANQVRESLQTLSCPAETRKTMLARDIASHANLPPAQTAKLLQLLTWAGFVKSRRGSKGGFWLAMPPKCIRVKDVISFFEPGPRLRKASAGEERGSHSAPGCPSRQIHCSQKPDFRDFLFGKPADELLNSPREGSTLPKKNSGRTIKGAIRQLKTH